MGSVWNSSAACRSACDNLSCGLPASPKALVLGARQVTFGAWSRVSQRPVLLRAASRADSWVTGRIVLEQGAGGLRILWGEWVVS